MGLIKCPDCGRDVSDAAPSCPNCGRPTRVQAPPPGQVAPSKKKTSPLAWGCLVVLLGVLGLFVLAALLVDHSTTDRVRSPEVGGPPAAPQLELKGFSWHTEYGYAILEGQVTNVSSQPLKNVTAVASFYDAKGGFITSSEALIEYNPILPAKHRRSVSGRRRTRPWRRRRWILRISWAGRYHSERLRGRAGKRNEKRARENVAQGSLSSPPILTAGGFSTATWSWRPGRRSLMSARVRDAGSSSP